MIHSREGDRPAAGPARWWCDACSAAPGASHGAPSLEGTVADIAADMDEANERMGAEIVRLRARLAEVEAERDEIEEERAELDRRARAAISARTFDNEMSRDAIAAYRGRAEVAEARLAEVEALCERIGHGTVWTDKVLAAARGEGDRPDSAGTEICWDCCKTNDHARHGEATR